MLAVPIDAEVFATAMRAIGRTFRLPACMLAIGMVLLGTNPAWPRPVTDEYILGFATSVLHHEFHVVDAKLTVHDGVIWVNGRGLNGINQDKLKRALSSIEGVKRVIAGPRERGLQCGFPHGLSFRKILRISVTPSPKFPSR